MNPAVEPPQTAPTPQATASARAVVAAPAQTSAPREHAAKRATIRTSNKEAPRPRPERAVAPARPEPRARATKVAPEPAAAPTNRSSAAETLARSATDAMLRGDTQTAASRFDQAIKADAGYAPAWRGKGLLLERSGRTREAAAAFREFLRLSPNSPGADAIRRRVEALQ
jgi:tetratricopeptide (TPR) repeat protein